MVKNGALRCVRGTTPLQHLNLRLIVPRRINTPLTMP
jgi:hypothetical protein